MPGCAKFLDEIDPTTMVDTPESIKLWLPSALPNRDTLCTPGLSLIEFRLRYAQAIDSLDHLRRLLRLVRGLKLQSQKHPVPTEKTRTRTRSVFDGLQVRIAQVCARYRDAYTALRRLHPSGGWRSFFQEMKKDDIRGPGRELDEFSESRFIPSWIWTRQAPLNPPDLPGTTQAASAGTDHIDHNSPKHGATFLSPTPPNFTPMGNTEISEREIEVYVMGDWAKAHERAKRFEEEVELCMEEMRRTLLFFSWSAAEWEQRAQLGDLNGRPLSGDVVQGLQAYALRRSAMFRELIKVFVSDWYTCLEPKGLGAEWLAQYSDVIAARKGWNKIPSIIPPTPAQPDAEPDDAVLSDIDEALEQAEAGTYMIEDAESELHESFIQIFAEE